MILNEKVLISRGKDSLRNKKFSDALEFFSSAIKINPNNPLTFNERGKIFDRLRNNNKALIDSYEFFYKTEVNYEKIIQEMIDDIVSRKSDYPHYEIS